MSDKLDIQLLGREYHVACAAEEREALLQAAAYLDAKMRELADKTRSAGERLAVMTALNITHELLQARRASGLDVTGLKRRITSMQSRIDEALSSQEKLF